MDDFATKSQLSDTLSNYSLKTTNPILEGEWDGYKIYKQDLVINYTSSEPKLHLEYYDIENSKSTVWYKFRSKPVIYPGYLTLYFQTSEIPGQSVVGQIIYHDHSLFSLFHFARGQINYTPYIQCYLPPQSILSVDFAYAEENETYKIFPSMQINGWVRSLVPISS